MYFIANNKKNQKLYITLYLSIYIGKQSTGKSDYNIALEKII